MTVNTIFLSNEGYVRIIYKFLVLMLLEHNYSLFPTSLILWSVIPFNFFLKKEETECYLDTNCVLFGSTYELHIF